MSLSIKTGVGSLTSGISRASSQFIPPPPPLKIGKVMGVITTNNTPTTKQFDRAGNFGGMGSIFFLNYDNSKNIDPNNTDSFLDTCDIAKPLFPNFSYYPLLGELVYIIEGLPSPSSQITSGATQKYYITTINLWSDVQVNSQTFSSKSSLGKYFVEDASIRSLLKFEGDFVLQGRKGNSIRFGTTVRAIGNLNEWSNVGTVGSPIIIISNGHSYDKNKEYYLEQINQDASSIYLTTNQSIPLKIEVKDPINPITSPISISNYLESQLIINANRVVINSKKDEVMIFASTNIEISTNNTINLNSGKSIYLNIKEENPTTSTGPSPKIILGTQYNNKPAIEPLLLGNKTADFLLTLISALDAFALSLTATSTNSEGSPLAKVQGSAEALQTQLNLLYKKIQPLKSNSIFII